MEDKKELSPGLWYLEQVCQFLEDIAQKRINNQIVQMDTDSVCKEGTQVSHVATFLVTPLGSILAFDTNTTVSKYGKTLLLLFCNILFREMSLSSFLEKNDLILKFAEVGCHADVLSSIRKVKNNVVICSHFPG